MKEAIVIRVAEASDAEGIGKVHSQGWHETYDGIFSKEFLDKQTPELRAAAVLRRIQGSVSDIFVAVRGNEILGFAEIGRSRDEALAPAEIYAIYLLNKNQRAGIGSELLKACLEEAEDRSYSKVLVSVLSQNLKAIAFYKKHEAELIGSGQLEIEGTSFETLNFAWSLD